MWQKIPCRTITNTGHHITGARIKLWLPTLAPIWSFSTTHQATSLFFFFFMKKFYYQHINLNYPIMSWINMLNGGIQENIILCQSDLDRWFYVSISVDCNNASKVISSISIHSLHHNSCARSCSICSHCSIWGLATMLFVVWAAWAGIIWGTLQSWSHWWPGLGKCICSEYC